MELEVGSREDSELQPVDRIRMHLSRDRYVNNFQVGRSSSPSDVRTDRAPVEDQQRRLRYAAAAPAQTQRNHEFLQSLLTLRLEKPGARELVRFPQPMLVGLSRGGA